MKLILIFITNEKKFFQNFYFFKKFFNEITFILLQNFN